MTTMSTIDKTAELRGNFKAGFESLDGGHQYDLQQILYRCPQTNSLLDVVHERGPLQTVAADRWKSLFEDRMSSFAHPWSSGVWSKKEWVLPEIDQEHIVTLGEGRTPLLPLHRLAEELQLGELYLKQCGVSHTGSFKDLGMTVLVSHVKSLRARGLPIRAVACASTGDTSAALAAYASAAGIPTVVFLPAGKISMAQLVQPIANGSLVLSLDTDFDGCMRIVQEVTHDQGIYLANSMNPLRIEGQKTVSIELCQQLAWQVPDWIIIPGGNLGNVSALAAGLELLKDTGVIDRYPRICVAQAAHANPLYLSYQRGFDRLDALPARKTLASAIQIGNPVSYQRAVRALKNFAGVVEQATEEELANAAARTDMHGMFNCPHTGVALASLFKLIDNKTIAPGQKVVVISTAHGLKFSEFKSGYHEDKLDLKARYKNQPLSLSADVDEVRRVLDRELNK